MDNPQPSPKCFVHMDAVQRLDVGRLKHWFGLKIESDPPEMESKDKRPNQPRALEGSINHYTIDIKMLLGVIVPQG